MNARSLICLSLALVTSVGSAAAEYRESAKISQSSGVETLDIEGGRLVEQGVLQLILNHGYRISYEDPRYSNPDDLVDITEQVTGKAATNDVSRIVAPKSRSMSVKLQTAKGAEGSLGQIVSAAAAANPGARFQVLKDGTMLHVVPTGVRDMNGNVATQGSVLDTPITLALDSPTASEALTAICTAVSKASGQRVLIGTHGYIGYEGEARYPVAASEEPARNVLKRLLDAIAVKRGQATWLLLFGNQKTDNQYYLSIMQLPEVASVKPAPLPVPSAAKRPVTSQDPAAAPGK